MKIMGPIDGVFCSVQAIRDRPAVVAAGEESSFDQPIDGRLRGPGRRWRRPWCTSVPRKHRVSTLQVSLARPGADGIQWNGSRCRPQHRIQQQVIIIIIAHAHVRNRPSKLISQMPFFFRSERKKRSNVFRQSSWSESCTQTIIVSSISWLLAA